MFKSATLKLTAWYLGLAMTISILFSIVLYHIGTNEIARSIHLQSERIYNQFPVFYNNPILRPGSDIDDSDHNLLLRLIFLNLVVLILAGIACYLLARRTLEPIEEAHLQQKRFTSDVSHELRTPLTALKMESEVALLNPHASIKDLKATLKSNLEEVNKLESLINNILKLARLEIGELRQSFLSSSTKDIAAEALKQVESQAKRRDITLKQDISSPSIYGDRDSLVQLLVILLDNAIKYSPSGSLVELSAEQKANAQVITIRDRGIGIHKDALEHIFDRFYQAENSRSKTKDAEGYGLGLSIAKMIADLHGAVITVSSQLGKGTEVEVSFPQPNSH